jgi:ABC-type oligopeptide transport system ATPase subunit
MSGTAPDPVVENAGVVGDPTIAATDVAAVRRDTLGEGDNILQVRELRKEFPITKGLFVKRQVGAVKAVDGISFDVRRGETFGVVGESGCGKSTTARMVCRLLDPTSGQIDFEGTDIAGLSTKQLVPFRRDVQMVFQDPYSSLNPRQTIGSIIGTPLDIHGIATGDGERKRKVQDLMDLVGLNPEHYNRLPHEFSGGQRQRIGIARAIALGPKLLIADEPVSALDVSIQAQILNLLRQLQRDLGLSLMFIAHDLSVVRYMCDRIAVMYAGQIVELATSDELFAAPSHPYTRALLDAVPTPDPNARARRLAERGTATPPAAA